jgi:hypothetical protein
MSTALNVLALLFAGRGLMNVLKRFGTGSGLVFFGRLLPADTLLAPAIGLAMIAYAWGLWTRAGWAIPLGVAYAVFATANLLLFPVFTPMPERIPMWAYAIYVVGGIALSWGSVWLLRQARSVGGHDAVRR